MKLRAATEKDLPQLKAVYETIIRHMEENGLRIWDEVYPCICFPGDIENRRLYILEENREILSAFALCDTHTGSAQVTWRDGQAKALYIDRLGVNAAHQKRGIGSAALQHAIRLAKEQGAEYVRLFVVDSNTPAIGLYRKNGFSQAGGIYAEVIDKSLTLREFGFEIETA